MAPTTLALLTAAAAFSSFVYAYFAAEKEGDSSLSSRATQQSPDSPPHRPSPYVFNPRGQATFTPSDPGHNRDSYYYSTHTPTTRSVNSRSTPSASTHPQPSYQQPQVKPRTPQATANTNGNLESSPLVHHHGLASSSSQTVPAPAAQAQIPHPTQSNASRTTPTTSDHLNRISLSSTNARDPRLTLTPSASTLAHTSYTAQQTSARGAQTTTRTDYDNSPHRSEFPSSSSVWDSYQTTPTRTHTHAFYPAQQTSAAQLGQTTSRTPPRSDYDSSLHRSDFASPSVWESRQTPSTPTRTHALYSALETSTRVGTTVRTPPTMTDYDDDDMGPSPYSYLRAPSPDASRARVPRLTVSPQKHSRTHSSSSDSDYLSPSSHTRRAAVPRSRHDAIADAEDDRKKALELRDQAKRSARDMLEARDRAKIAHRKGDYEAEDEYGQEARAHESKKKNSDKLAAKIFFKVNNKAREEGTVDLHNLYVAEAEEYAKKELESALYRNDDTVTFIVGQGRHSEDGVSKLRPALETIFDERRLRYSLDPGNAGKLIVYLH